MEVETAIRKYLLAQSGVTGYVGGRVYKFQLMEPVHATSHRAVVIKRVGQWGTPDSVQTSEYPLVQVECWADPDRDADGNVLVMNALDKAFAVQRTIDPFLHGKRGVKFSDLDVVSTQRWSESIIVTQDDQHGQGNMGDAAYVATRYALHVVH